LRAGWGHVSVRPPANELSIIKIRDVRGLLEEVWGGTSFPSGVGKLLRADASSKFLRGGPGAEKFERLASRKDGTEREIGGKLCSVLEEGGGGVFCTFPFAAVFLARELLGTLGRERR